MYKVMQGGAHDVERVAWLLIIILERHFAAVVV